MTINAKAVRIDMDGEVHDVLVKVREAIAERNRRRTLAGEFDRYEGETIKQIIQRGVISVAKEVLADN